MRAEIDLLIQPYSVPEGRSLLHLLIQEFSSGQWNTFQAAVAFARTSGNYDELCRAMLQFAKGGGRIDISFGADIFSGDNAGSDYEAVEELLKSLGGEPTVRLFLYHEKGRTFHPKLYLFKNEAAKRGLLVVGSSNWSTGGFWDNIEVNVVLHLDLNNAEHEACHRQVQQCFDEYWTEQAT